VDDTVTATAVMPRLPR